MVYRVILVSNGVYKKTFHRSSTKDTAFIHFNKIKEENKVLFPKKHINTNSIKPVKYKLCITKITEKTDIPRTLRDEYGKTYIEKPIGDWTILESTDFDIEEHFWIFGMNSKLNRPTISDIVKKLVTGAYKKNMVKQVIVAHNKLIIHNEDQFDMVICKCKEDAQRLHHTLAKISKKQKIKSLLFMGTASDLMISRLYDLIQEKTGWPRVKVTKRTTSP